uniref:molybdopterin biosynthesis protein n=1 Tax=Glaucosphaera vacuolata TaxID=38265 RepID=UPI001FCCC653|nr:molybdopterin biosynthesis protein [Glaucosphaera vacuolata]UNJ18744.1 molybdopterin biosynthesis protein [Glaucosphaera vacuolata]
MFHYKNIYCNLMLDEYSRYSRHLTLSYVGLEGQKKLKMAKVICIGAGGLASSILLYLVASGLGTLGIVDDDYVDLSNLQRQIIFRMQDLDYNKVTAAFNHLSSLNSNCKIDLYPTRLDSLNVIDLYNKYDFIIDCTDNFITRYLLNDASLMFNKPIVYGAISQFHGQVSVFNYQGGPNYKDLYPQIPILEMGGNCIADGVLGVLPGLIGILQATELVKMIIGIGNVLSGRVLLYDALDMKFRELKLKNKTTAFHKYPIRLKEKGTIISKDYLRQHFDKFIDIAELKNLLNLQNIYLVNVGVTQEIKNIPTLVSHNIALADMPSNLNFLQIIARTHLIILFCKTNTRAFIAYHFLQKYNIDAKVLNFRSTTGDDF